jgi:small subunit ribosomal protein S16
VRMAQWTPYPAGTAPLTVPSRVRRPPREPDPHPVESVQPPHLEPGDSTPVAVKIRLKRMGKIRAPYYRIVVADSRTKRDGRAIEEIGKYHPTHEPSVIEVDSERARYWLSVGAQPTEQVRAILKITGDWQAFKGEPGSEGTLRVAPPKADKKAAFQAAAKEAMAEPKEGATTPKSRKGRSKPAAEAAPAEAAPAEATTEAATTEKAPETAEAQPAAEGGKAAAGGAEA